MMLFQLSAPLEDSLRCEAYELFIGSLTPYQQQFTFEAIGNCTGIQLFLHATDEALAPVVGAAWRRLHPGGRLVHVEDDPLAQLVRHASGEVRLLDVYAPPPYYWKLTHRSPEEPPLSALLLMLSQLDESDLGFFQLLFLPVKKNWRANINALLVSERVLGDRAPFGKTSAKQMKAHWQPLFAVGMRIGCLSSDIVRFQSFVGGFDWSGRQLLIRTERDFLRRLSSETLVQMIQRRLSHTLGMLLSSEELAFLLHLPTKETLNRDVLVSGLDEFPIPPALTEAGRPLGAINGTTICLPNRLKNKNIYIIGSSTAGKSTALLHQLIWLANTGEGVVVIDPHADLAEEFLSHLQPEHMNRVVYFNPAAPGQVLKYNPFAGSSANIGKQSNDFVSAFEGLFVGGTGHRMLHLLNAGIAGLITAGLNLASLPTLYSKGNAGQQLRRRIVPFIRNPELRRFFEHELQTYSEDSFSPILNKVSRLLQDENAHRVFSQNDNAICIPTVLQKGQIFVASLALGMLGAEVTSLLGSFLLAQFQNAAFAQGALPLSQRKQLHIVCDEFYRFRYAQVFASILDETRKYGLSLTLAHQETGQIPDSILRALLSVPTAMVFNVNIEDARKMQRLFQGKVSVNDITSLGVGEVYANVVGNVVRLRTFPPLSAGNVERAEEIRQHSYERYYTPIAEVEEVPDQVERHYDVF
jgi:hypothetical protein